MNFKHLRTYITLVTSILIILIFIIVSLITVNLNKKLVLGNIITIHKEITNKVLIKLDSYLSVPYTINNLNDSFLRIDPNNLLDLDPLRKFFHKQLSIFKTVNLIAFGTEEGKYVESQRLKDGSVRTGNTLNGDLELWETDRTGDKTKLDKLVKNYNPRLRPWYIDSRNAQKPTWSDIYLFSSNNQPAISANQPFLLDNGNIGGVITTSITLDGISHFLDKLSSDNESSVLILEPSGLVVATSKNIPLLDSENHRKTLKELHNPIFSALTEVFDKNVEGNYTNLITDFSFSINKTEYLVRSTPYYNSQGLRWNVLVIIPENNYMIPFYKMRTLGLISFIIFILLTPFLSYFIAGKVTKPILELSTNISEISLDQANTNFIIPEAISRRNDEIGILAKTFLQMQSKIQSVFSDLMKSQKEYKSLVENSNSIIMKVRPDGVITYCNQFGLDFYGYSEKELIGSRVQDTVLKTNKPEDFKILENIFNQDKRYWNGTNRNITSRGDEVWILWSNTMIYDQDGNIKELLSIGQDFTSRRAAQIELKDSLEEKNILLKEIHHRVKNNLQIINSLVNLQLSDVSNTKVQETLETLQSRIQSMALVHEMLYSSDSFTKIDFHDYIGQIISTISATFNNPEHPVNVLLNGDTFYMDIERATSCGLLINEILINAFKHAFKGKEDENNSRIEITLHKSKLEIVEIIIKDNGIGITGLSQTSDTAGMGTLLIDALTDQIGGTITISKNKGTSVSLVFKNS